MAANSSSRGITSLGKRFVDQIWTRDPSRLSAPILRSIRGNRSLSFDSLNLLEEIGLRKFDLRMKSLIYNLEIGDWSVLCKIVTKTVNIDSQKGDRGDKDAYVLTRKKSVPNNYISLICCLIWKKVRWRESVTSHYSIYVTYYARDQVPYLSFLVGTSRQALSTLRAAAHTSAYDKNPDEHAQSTVVPDDLIESKSDKYWAPDPQTGVFGPAAPGQTARPSGGTQASTPASGEGSVLEQTAWFRPTSIEDLEKPAAQ
ncbi:hypothetical protein F8388_024529 [Cannabis sativa]|uniref:Uncharacterized protein n=1 Tax=Cannabis sativa TaxID=3483 RepID=A0A7J6GBA3_CANSA|nr:hypothetical protein F8388_024529 [Cannabis sativa]